MRHLLRAKFILAKGREIQFQRVNQTLTVTKCKCNPPTVSHIYKPSGYKAHVNARWKESDPVGAVSQSDTWTLTQ